MRHRSLTFVLSFAALLLICGATRPATAQILGTGGTTGILGSGGTTGTTTTFATTDFFVGVQQTQGVNLSTFDAARFFDVARCQCNTPVWLFIALLPSGFAKRATAIGSTGNTGSISVWLGAGCNNPLMQTSTLCRQIGHEPLLTFLNQGSWTIPTDAQTLSAYLGTSVETNDAGATTATTGSSAPCTAPTGTFTQTVNILVDIDGDGYPELTIGDSIYVDLDPPPSPTGVTIQGGNQALIVKWNQVDQAVITDLVGYQILCSRAGQYQVFMENGNDAGGASGPFGSGFESCPSAQTGTGIAAADPTFICSGLLSPVATSYRIETLQNDIYYAVGVVSVDNSGNASSAPPILFGKPVRTLSFYDVYRDGYADSNNTGGGADPGAANGGFCAVASRRPRWRSTATALAGIGIVVTGVSLARRRRRQGRR